MSEFKWRIALLDDNLRDLASSVEVFEKLYRFEVVTAERPSDFFGSSLDKICGCHVALVDMVWENFGDAGMEPKSIPEPLWQESGIAMSPEKVREELEAFTKQWIEAVEAWTSDSTSSWASVKWPRKTIENTEVGLWLAGLLSHVSPEAEIILFSGGPNVGGEGALAALGRFREPKYRVVKKPNVGGIDVRELLPALEKVQARVIERDITFRKWFVGSVLVPLIVGGNPAQGQARILTPFGTSMEMDLVPEIVFPQLARAKDDEEKVKVLLRFLPKPLLTPPQRVTLEAVLHDLEDKKLDGLTTDTIEKWVWQLLPLCFHAGEVGIALSSALVAALTSPDVKQRLKALRIVWQDAFSTLFSARYSIRSLCDEYSQVHAGRYICAKELSWPTTLTDTVREAHTAESHFRGNMAELRTLVLALRDNAKKYGAKAWCLNAVECEDALGVTWLDDSRGFRGIGQFREAVRNSTKKGIDRGFPGVLAAALRLGAIELWVLVGEKDRSWNRLLPNSEMAVPSADETWARYGFRLKLAKSL
jgi:hypothetical protein